MAKARRGRSRGGVNKSQAIREYLANNPNAPPKDVAEALRAQGIRVSSQLVSNVKTMRGTRGRRAGRPAAAGRGAGRRGARRGRAGADSISVQNLLDAKRVIEQVGSVEAVRKALDALESLRV
jgi:hypothetical protein